MACQGGFNEGELAVSITHCPLCVGLAVLSAVRFMAHGLMLWPLVRPTGSFERDPSFCLPDLIGN